MIDVSICHCGVNWGSLGCTRLAQTRQATKSLAFPEHHLYWCVENLQRLQVLWSLYLPSATCCWYFMVFYMSVSLCHWARRSDDGARNTRICCRDKDTQGAHLETRMSPRVVMWVTATVPCDVAQEKSQLQLKCSIALLAALVVLSVGAGCFFFSSVSWCITRLLKQVTFEDYNLPYVNRFTVVYHRQLI